MYFMYVRRDIVAAYKQTILGPLWYVIQPLFTMVIYMFIFGDLAKIPTDGIPQPLFYFSGIMLWNYFLSSFGFSSDIFIANNYLFGKVYFPRLIIPFASMTANLFKFGIQFLMFIIIYLYFLFRGLDISVNWTILLLPLLIIILSVYSLSWGIILSSMTYKYRDLRQIITFGMQLFMYVTPVVYPLNATPNGFKFLIELNPLTPVFEIFRYGTMDCGSISWWNLGYSCGLMIITFFAALSIFNQTEKTFMDSV